MNKMNSKYILKVDVGGQIFKTNVNTLCKYPNSMLCAMFSHTNSGLTPMPKTEKGHFFLDADPIYFRVILNWLRLGKVTLDNPGLLKGTMALAEYFGLDELTEELKVIEKKNNSNVVTIKAEVSKVKVLRAKFERYLNWAKFILAEYEVEDKNQTNFTYFTQFAIKTVAKLRANLSSAFKSLEDNNEQARVVMAKHLSDVTRLPESDLQVQLELKKFEIEYEAVTERLDNLAELQETMKKTKSLSAMHKVAR